MIRQEAMDVMAEGFNCAETAMIMAGRYYLPEINICYSKLVTGFGGGVGRSRKEACGALTGCITALSILIGRESADVSVDPIHERMSEIRDKFIEKFGTTTCELLREGYEGEEAVKMCHNMTADMIVVFFEFLDSIGIRRKV